MAVAWDKEKWRVEDVTDHLVKDMFPMFQADLDPDAWQLATKSKLSLVSRIRSAGVTLGEYVNGRFYRGILTGLNDAFVVPRGKRDELIAAHPSSKEILRPFLRGRDIKRWKVDFEDIYLLFVPWHFPLHEDGSIIGASKKAERAFAEKYPAIYAHLRSHKPELSARNQTETGIRYEWYALQRFGSEYWREFSQPKLIVPAISETVNFAPDTNGFFCNNKATIFVPESVAFTCAIVNSQVSAWLAAQTFATKQGGFLDFEPRYSGQLVVPHATAEQQRIVECIAEGVILLQNDSGMAAFLERLLNALVYELFFPKDLHEQKLRFFDLVGAAGAPSGSDSMEWKAFGGKVSDVNHPVYAALFSLNAVEVVRIIEDRE